MKRSTTKQGRRETRRARVRATIAGTKDCPRLNVFRSLRYVFVQLIDDGSGKTIASVNSRNLKSTGAGDRKGKIAEAYLAGKDVAEKAKVLKITSVVFDRAGYKYHGRVKAVAEGARDNGLQF